MLHLMLLGGATDERWMVVILTRSRMGSDTCLLCVSCAVAHTKRRYDAVRNKRFKLGSHS